MQANYTNTRCVNKGCYIVLRIELLPTHTRIETCKFPSSWSVITLEGNHRDWHWLPASCTARIIVIHQDFHGDFWHYRKQMKSQTRLRHGSPRLANYSQRMASPSSSNGMFIKRRNVLMVVRTFVFLSSPCAVTNRAIFASRESLTHVDFNTSFYIEHHGISINHVAL